MPQSSECAFRDIHGRGCQFAGEHEGEVFLLDDTPFCLFHAPLEARSPHSGKLKSDVDVNRFNEAVLEIIVASGGRARGGGAEGADRSAVTGEAIFMRAFSRLLKDSGAANLNGTVFPGRFSASGVTVADLSMSECVLPDGLDLVGSTFEGDFICERSRFERISSFAGSTVKGKVRIDDCTFAGPLYLSDVTFAGPIVISRSRFEMLHICKAVPAAEKDSLSLTDSTFDAYVCLKNRRFFSLDFSGSTFRGELNMAGAEIGDDVRFSGAEYLAVSPDGRRYYSTLRRLATGVGDLRAAEVFRALEFECQARSSSTPRFTRLLLSLYGLSSRYGTDAFRPVVLLIALNAAFAAAIAALILAGGAGADVAFSGAAWHVGTNVFHLPAAAVPIDPAAAGFFATPSWPRAILTLLQSIATYLLVALFAHAIFRMFSRA